MVGFAIPWPEGSNPEGKGLVLQPTPKAIHTFNNSHAKKIGLFHVTC
jgi:hypothetical protein